MTRERQLLRNKSFAGLFTGQTVSVWGTAISSLLLPLVAVRSLGADPMWLGLIGASTWIPWLLIGVQVGAWVDRRDARRVMMCGSLIGGCAIGVVPVLWLLGCLTVGQLVATALVLGLCEVLVEASWPVLLASSVKDSDLESANSLLSVSQSAAMTLGRPLGGLIATVVAPALGVTLDALSYFAAVAALALGGPAPAHEKNQSRTELTHGRRHEGWTLMWSDRYLRSFTLVGCGVNVGVTGYQTLLVLFLLDDLRLSSLLVGLVLMSGGLGNVIGARLAPRASSRWGSSRGSVVFSGVTAVSVLLVPAGRSGVLVALTVVGLFGTGLSVAAGNVIRLSWRQRYVPGGLLAGVNTAGQWMLYSLMPVAALVAGRLAEVFSVRGAMAAFSVVACLSSLALGLTPVGRSRLLPRQYSGGQVSAATGR